MEIKNTIYTFEDVKNVYSKYIHNPEELDKIYQAYLFASEKHKNQVRKSGDPYIVHLLGVARILSELNTGPTTIIAGLLQCDRRLAYSRRKSSYDEILGKGFL